MSDRSYLDIPDPEVAAELDKMPGSGPVPSDIPSARIAFDNFIVVRARKAAEPFVPPGEIMTLLMLSLILMMTQNLNIV